jgi:hypothetical protein
MNIMQIRLQLQQTQLQLQLILKYLTVLGEGGSYVLRLMKRHVFFILFRFRKLWTLYSTQ